MKKFLKLFLLISFMFGISYGLLFNIVKAMDVDEIIAGKVYESDLNNDGKSDIWQTFNDEGKPITRSGDLNFDGKIDVVVKFDHEKGMEITEQDKNFDGKIDIWSEIPIEDPFAPEKESSIKKDTNFDGKVNTWLYSKGKSARIEYDTNFDGEVDIWEYREEGKLIKKEIDTDFDGVPDKSL